MIKNLKRRIHTFFTSNKIIEKHLANQSFYPRTYTETQDIFTAGFPKSGNSWMQSNISSLLFGIDPQYLPDRLIQEIVPDVNQKKYYKRFLPFTCFKTHGLPKPEYRRVIHLIRDGRDAMASYFAMKKAQGKDILLEDMIVHGEGVFPCKWNEHTRKWIENPYDAEIMIVKYEDLLYNPKKEFEKICAFIGLDRSQELIERCINGNSFNAMRKRAEKYGSNNKNWNKSEKFHRKGKSGTYKTELPQNMIDYFTEEAKKELNHFGYL